MSPKAYMLWYLEAQFPLMPAGNDQGSLSYFNPKLDENTAILKWVCEGGHKPCFSVVALS